jgi:hypothetical protein
LNNEWHYIYEETVLQKKKIGLTNNTELKIRKFCIYLNQVGKPSAIQFMDVNCQKPVFGSNISKKSFETK